MKHSTLTVLVLTLFLGACSSSDDTHRPRKDYSYDFQATSCAQPRIQGQYQTYEQMCQALLYQMQSQPCAITPAQRVFEAENCHRSDIFTAPTNNPQLNGPGVYYDYGQDPYISNPDGPVEVDADNNLDELPIDDGLIEESGIVRKRWQNYYVDVARCKAVIDDHLEIDLSTRYDCNEIEPEGEGETIYFSGNEIVEKQDQVSVAVDTTTNTGRQLEERSPRPVARPNTTIKTIPEDSNDNQSPTPRQEVSNKTPTQKEEPAQPEKAPQQEVNKESNEVPAASETAQDNPTKPEETTNALDYNLLQFNKRGWVLSEVPRSNNGRVPFLRLTGLLDERSPLFGKKHANGTDRLETQLVSPEAGSCELQTSISTNAQGAIIISFLILDTNNAEMVEDCRTWMHATEENGLELKVPNLKSESGNTVTGHFKALSQIK